VLKRWVVRGPHLSMRYWIALAVVVSRLGAGRRMRVKMFVLGLVTPLRDRWLSPRDAKVRLRYGRLEVPWTVGPKSDFEVLNAVLVLSEYGELPPIEPTTVLDLGSHIGTSVLVWRERFPQARIIAVEPDPVTFGRLRRNVGSWPGVELHNAAVAEQDGPVRFLSARQGWISSLSRGWGKPVIVSGRTFRSLVRAVGEVDLLKVDIEGAEHYILDDWALQGVKAIVGEYHNTGGREERERFFARLRTHFDVTVTETAPFGFFGSRRKSQARDASAVISRPGRVEATDGWSH
jgi:FkbM family methyltransferase